MNSSNALGLRHAPGRSLSVEDATGHTLATYHYGTDAPRSYFHPVAPPGAPPLSLRPHDHVWHLGLFFSWKFVDDTNFWEFGHAHVASRALAVTTHVAGRVSWIQQNEWIRGPAADEPALLREERRIHVCWNDHRRYTISWESTFHSDQPRRLHSDPDRGYAGIGIRLIRDFQASPRLLAAGGQNQVATVRGAREPWAAWQGRYDTTLDWAGIAVFEHPTNPGYPAPIFVGKQLTAMAFLGSGFVFERDHIIHPGDPLTLRYGIVIHNNEATAAEYTAWYDAYCTTEIR